MLYRKNSNCKISSDIEEDYSCMCVTIVRVATDFIIIVTLNGGHGYPRPGKC